MRQVTNVTSDAAALTEADETIFDDQIRNSKGRVVEPPALAADVQIADTHCHLDMLRHPELALARAAALGVSFLVSVTDPSEDAAYTYREIAAWKDQAAELLKQWKSDRQPPKTRVIIGCHPHNSAKYDAQVESAMLELIHNQQTVAIGEIGLDYHYDASPRDVQRQVFRRQLELALNCDLPVALHLREAHADGLAILDEVGWPPAGVLLHCYTLGYREVQPFLERGAQVAFGGTLTFKKADELRDAAARISLDRIVTETDAPFMTPEPVRGTLCGPEHTAYTAACLARVRGADDDRQTAEVLAAVYQNALRFFDR